VRPIDLVYTFTKHKISLKNVTHRIENWLATKYKEDEVCSGITVKFAFFRTLVQVGKTMQDFLTNIQNVLGLAWWVEVKTDEPRCVYYFGPFSDEATAQSSHSGYIEDLEKEGAKNITVAIKRCKPEQLTVADDLGKLPGKQLVRAF
jgi:Domain of unknown function (DUF1816)